MSVGALKSRYASRATVTAAGRIPWGTGTKTTVVCVKRCPDLPGTFRDPVPNPNDPVGAGMIELGTLREQVGGGSFTGNGYGYLLSGDSGGIGEECEGCFDGLSRFAGVDRRNIASIGFMSTAAMLIAGVVYCTNRWDVCRSFLPQINFNGTLANKIPRPPPPVSRTARTTTTWSQVYAAVLSGFSRAYAAVLPGLSQAYAAVLSAFLSELYREVLTYGNVTLVADVAGLWNSS